MGKSLRFISISHQTASVALREKYHIPDEEKNKLVALICQAFPDISGLLLLVTCNRTEIYFESETTTDTTVRDFLINLTSTGQKEQQLFKTGNTTETTVKHLLEVSSGLASSVLGDAEIVHQIKKAYQNAVARKLHGSLLERALQSVFKSHKRISNETHFRDGTTSVAYKALKMITTAYDKATVKSKKILFIGAGDIVLQLFKYNSKFKFKTIYISNRTEEKAQKLAQRFSSKAYAWDKVRANNFEDFDVIISAVSNCPKLVKKMPFSATKRLLIDLALPGNFDISLSDNENVLLYDLDTISTELEENREKRFEAIGTVKNIIGEELMVYKKWLEEAPLRSLLAEYKIIVQQKVIGYFKTKNKNKKYNPQMIKTVTDRVIRKLKKETDVASPIKQLTKLIEEQATL